MIGTTPRPPRGSRSVIPNRSNAAPPEPRRAPANLLRSLRLPAIALFALASLLGLPGCGPKKANTPRWVVYYGQNAAPEELTGDDVVVVDPNDKGAIAPLRKGGAKVLAYLSLGELNASRATFARAQHEGLLARGYDGLFLDTLESALHLQTRDAARYAGMQ